jgi:hypothetical protein
MNISKKNYNAITRWKIKHGIDVTDIAEYFYLMRDLQMLYTRAIDPEVDPILPLGGDGPALGDILKVTEKMHIQYVSPIGEKLYKYLIDGDQIGYNDYLFWLILKNKAYYPHIQDIIENPKSYRKTDVTFAFSHVSLYPVPFSINLAESLSSYATDGAITIIAERLRKTPKNVKNIERILLFIFYPLINRTGTSKFMSCTIRGL